MNLNKNKWTKEDGVAFKKYLETLSNVDKVEWTRNILNTKMPFLAIKTPDLKNIVKEIMKGDYISFLNLNMNHYYENIAVNGLIISKLKDIDLVEKYLEKYVVLIDNWALCDILSFNFNNNEDEYYQLALKYLDSDKPFIKRVGLNIMFKFINNDNYIDKVFDVMNSFYKEEEYYVNMMIAWMFCECFIKQRKKTLFFLKNHKLNKFTINKGISKCRDSYRVSKEDKDMLLQYKKIQ